MKDNETPRAKLARKAALWNQRSSWVEHYKELSEYIEPYLGQYFVDESNKDRRSRQNNIYDSHAMWAQQTLAAGMMSGMTSPARPWSKFTLADKDLMQSQAVKSWLNRSGEIVRTVFAQSNTYRALHSCYEELGLFGTWANILLKDRESVIHHYPLTAGEYALATNHKGYVDTMAREFKMTVAQLMGQFGRNACSQTVRNLYDSNRLDQFVTVVHVIEPRKTRDPSRLDNKNMAFSSCYIEAGRENPDDFLSNSGFRRFPVLAPRWMVKGNDVYGNSPGMRALGDTKQLQHEQLKKSQAIDYQTNPPLQVPMAYKDAATNRLPGGLMYVDQLSGGGGVRSAYEVNLDLQHLLMDIQDVRKRIDRAFYADLFLMLANDTRSGVTATEIAERHEEKLLMLGPVLERLHNELLSPLVETTFDYCLEAGIFPPAPPELQGQQIDIEFTSTLAQAQKIVAAGGVDKLLGTVGSLVGIKPDITDKVNFDQVIDDYGAMYGVNPEIIVPNDKVQAIRQQRAEAAQAAQQQQAMAQAASAVKTVGDTSTEGLGNVLDMFQGYST